MTLDELQREAAALAAEERLRLAAFLKHLDRLDTPANRAELSRLNAAIDAGDSVTLEQWRETHGALQCEDSPGRCDSSHDSLFGLWKGKIILKKGWDDPLEEMKPYTE